MALIASHLNAGHSGGDSVAIGITILSLSPHLHTPFSPSLISLMVSQWTLSTMFSYLFRIIVQELCESRGGRPGLSVLTSLLVSVDVN